MFNIKKLLPKLYNINSWLSVSPVTEFSVKYQDSIWIRAEIPLRYKSRIYIYIYRCEQMRR